MEQHPEAGGRAVVTRARGYAIVVERADANWSAYAPDVPGCVSTGDTPDEAITTMREALAAHLALLREYGESVPEAHTIVATIAPEELAEPVTPNGSPGADEGHGVVDKRPRSSAVVSRSQSVIRGARSRGVSMAAVMRALGTATSIESLARTAFTQLAAAQIPTIDTAAIVRSYALSDATTSFERMNWESYFAAQSGSLRQVAQSINDNAAVTASAAIAALASQNMARLTSIATAIARQMSDAVRFGTYIIPIRELPGVPFVYEHTEDEDYLAAVARDEEGEDRVVILQLWRVDSGEAIRLLG